MADENKIRIKDQPLDTALSSGDFIIVDSEESGAVTRKFDLGAKLESIDTDITDVKADFNDFIGFDFYTRTTGGYIKTNVNVGATVSLTPVSAEQAYSYYIINCVGGDEFTINAVGGNAPRAWAFIDSNNALISKSGVGTFSNVTLTAPTFATKLIVNALTYEHYTPYVYKGKPLQGQINAKADVGVETGVFSDALENFVCGKACNFDRNFNYGSYPIETDSSKVVEYGTPNTITASGNVIYAETPSFDANGYFRLSANLASSSDATEWTLYAHIKKSDNSYQQKTVQALSNGDNDIIVDLAYYSVYFNAVAISFLIASYNASSVTRTITLKNYPNVTEYGGLTTNGNTIGEWFANVDSKVAEVETEVENASAPRGSQFIVAPNGTRYVQQVDNSLNVVNVPVVPSKTVFIGNSLLVGFGFGMCASDSTKDYLALFKAYVDSLGNTMSFERIAGADWEEQTTIEGQTTWLNTYITQSVLANANLVIVQLGDNVNTDSKRAIFKQGCINFLMHIRGLAPNAKVCWMGSWYAQELMDIAKNACESCGCSFVDIRTLATTENKGHYGQIVDWGSSRTTQYTDVTSYTNNGNGTITFTFTASGTSYTVTISCTSSTYDSTNHTLTVVGQYYVVTKSGVAGHPGDRGFRAIVNKMLYDLFVTDDTEIYELA